MSSQPIYTIRDLFDTDTLHIYLAEFLACGFDDLPYLLSLDTDTLENVMDHVNRYMNERGRELSMAHETLILNRLKQEHVRRVNEQSIPPSLRSPRRDNDVPTNRSYNNRDTGRDSQRDSRDTGRDNVRESRDTMRESRDTGRDANRDTVRDSRDTMRDSRDLPRTRSPPRYGDDPTPRDTIPDDYIRASRDPETMKRPTRADLSRTHDVPLPTDRSIDDRDRIADRAGDRDRENVDDWNRVNERNDSRDPRTSGDEWDRAERGERFDRDRDRDRDDDEDRNRIRSPRSQREYDDRRSVEDREWLEKEKEREREWQLRGPASPRHHNTGYNKKRHRRHEDTIDGTRHANNDPRETTAVMCDGFRRLMRHWMCCFGIGVLLILFAAMLYILRDHVRTTDETGRPENNSGWQFVYVTYIFAWTLGALAIVICVWSWIRHPEQRSCNMPCGECDALCAACTCCPEEVSEQCSCTDICKQISISLNQCFSCGECNCSGACPNCDCSCGDCGNECNNCCSECSSPDCSCECCPDCEGGIRDCCKVLTKILCCQCKIQVG